MLQNSRIKFILSRVYLFGCFLFFSWSGVSQNLDKFNRETFPVELIDSLIIAKRGLEDQIELLENDCNWGNKVGKKIDVFWLRTEEGDFFGHSFEYFLDCDNFRFIYWSPNPGSIFPIVDFMIEDLEDESKFVVAKRKHLKNKKRFKKYLEVKD